jgi:uncharacterized protein (TIGR02266 family)
VSASQKPAEKRRSPRVGVPRVVLKIQSAERLRANYLKDLSEGGLFLKADRLLPIDSDLTVELWPPGWTDPLALEAKVVRLVEPSAGGNSVPGMGVSFQNVSLETEGRLRQLLAEHGTPLDDTTAGDDPLEHVAALVGRLEEERARVVELTTLLIDARGENAAYQEQLQKVERQEGAQRELSEQANAEIDGLRHRLEEEQEMTRRLQGRVTALEGELEELRGKETRLRTLLGKAGIGGGAKAAASSVERRESPAKEKKATAANKANRAVPPAAPVELDLEDPFFDLAVDAGEPEHAPPPPPDRPAPQPAPPDALEVAFSDVIQDEPLGAPEHGGIATEEDLAAFLDETHETVEVASELIEEEPEIQTSIFDDRLGYDKFNVALKPDTRLLPNERLANRAPASVDEALIAQFVNAAPTFSTLLNQVGGSMKEQRLRQLLYELYARALIDIR